MIRDIRTFFDIHVSRYVGLFVERIREINARYATPRIAVTRTAAVALLILRIYLLALVGLLMYRFWTLL